MSDPIKHPPKPERELVNGLATLLCQGIATHPDLFEALQDELFQRGYRLCCEQRGIAGTYLRIVRDEPLPKG